MSLQDSFFNDNRDNRDNRDNFCDNVFVSRLRVQTYEAMASRRSHAPTSDQQIEYELRVPRSGTYIMKPTASCEAAQLWVQLYPTPIVSRRGTDTSTMMLRMIVGPASRNQERVR